MLKQNNKLSFKDQTIYVGLDIAKKSWNVTILTDKIIAFFWIPACAGMTFCVCLSFQRLCFGYRVARLESTSSLLPDYLFNLHYCTLIMHYQIWKMV